MRFLLLCVLLFCAKVCFAGDYSVVIKDLDKSTAQAVLDSGISYRGDPLYAELVRPGMNNLADKPLVKSILGWIGKFAVVAFIFWVGINSIAQVRPTQRGLIEMFGKYNRFASPGLNIVIPFIQKIQLVNITEKMVDVDSQEIITSDKLNAKVAAQIYYKIRTDEESLKKSQYNVNQVEIQIVSLARTSLRNIIGSMTLNEANSQRGRINSELLIILEKETGNWGIEIVRAELKEIDPPRDVQDTMNKVVKAANEKLAAVDFATAQETMADGEKRASIKRAEGERQSAILSAEGQKQSEILQAEGKAQALKLVNDMAKDTLTGAALELRRIEATETAFKNGTKIIVPSTGGNLINLIGEATK